MFTNRNTIKKIQHRYSYHILHFCFAVVGRFDCSCSEQLCTRSNFPLIQVVVTIDEEEGVSPPRVTPPRWVYCVCVISWLVRVSVSGLGYFASKSSSQEKVLRLLEVVQVANPAKSAQGALC